MEQTLSVNVDVSKLSEAIHDAFQEIAPNLDERLNAIEERLAKLEKFHDGLNAMEFPTILEG